MTTLKGETFADRIFKFHGNEFLWMSSFETFCGHKYSGMTRFCNLKEEKILCNWVISFFLSLFFIVQRRK